MFLAGNREAVMKEVLFVASVVLIGAALVLLVDDQPALSALCSALACASSTWFGVLCRRDEE